MDGSPEIDFSEQISTPAHKSTLGEALSGQNKFAGAAAWRSKLGAARVEQIEAEARYLIDRWRLFYNRRQIQRALGKLTPAAFAAGCPTLPPLRRARKAQLPCIKSHKGWTDESDPVTCVQAAGDFCGGMLAMSQSATARASS